jgi:Na+-transporting methylmalonyl-CoA/oxaloacetate decarboxylase gamma subunit
MMEISLGTALSLVGVALLALLLVLSAIAGLIYFITGVVKDKEEAEAPTKTGAEAGAAGERETKMKVALIAVAIARAAQSSRAGTSGAENEVNSWRQFHLARRLNQTLRVRRSP